MKIFGADIGLKNLAYCIIEYNENNIYEPITILEWKLLNICSERCLCSYISKRNNNKCYNPATIESDDKIKYCAIHKPKLKHLVKIKSCDKDTLYDYGHNMYQLLNQQPLVLSCDNYVIENQPALKNPKMKSISMILYSYFIFNSKSTVSFIQANQKLKISHNLTKEIIRTSKNKYKMTKDLSINICKYILNNDCNNATDYIEYFNHNNKQDDLADSFLHAYISIRGLNFYDNNIDFSDYIKNSTINNRKLYINTTISDNDESKSNISNNDTIEPVVNVRKKPNKKINNKINTIKLTNDNDESKSNVSNNDTTEPVVSVCKKPNKKTNNKINK